MTCPQCKRPHADEKQVTLHDGRQVGDCSEEWRAECEARFVLSIPSRVDRYAYLAGVQTRRGMAPANRLRADIIGILPKEHKEEVLRAMCGRLDTKTAKALRDLVRKPQLVAGQGDLLKL